MNDNLPIDFDPDTANVSRIPMARLAPPAPYDGSMDSAALRSWLFATERYLLVTKTSRDLWVLIASSFLTKHAALWFEAWFRSRMYKENAPAFLTWEEFATTMRTTFLPPNHDQHLRSRLDALVQSGRVSDYIFEFRNIQLELNMNDAEAIHAFVRGLRPMTQMQVRARDPGSLDDAISLADRLEDAYQATRRSFPPRSLPISSSTPRTLPKQSSYTSAASRKDLTTPTMSRPVTYNTSGPTPMIVDNVTTKLRPSDEQREGMRRRGECFRCGKYGHIGARCPSFPNRVYSLDSTEQGKEKDE